MASRRSVPRAEPILAGDDDDRLPPAEAAEFLGIAEETLRKWQRLGKIRHFNVGRRIMFSKRDLRAYLVECERPVL
jgi:excisionase family DNA binding protein